MVKIRGYSDILALEKGNYEEVVTSKSPYEAIVSSANKFGSKDAIRFLHRGVSDSAVDIYSYRDLIYQVNQAANAFHYLGVTRKKPVAFLLPSIPYAYFTLFGSETVGQVCPINYLLQAEHIAELIQASGSTVLVALGPHPSLDIWSKVDAIQANCPNLEHVLTVGNSVEGYQSLEALMECQQGDVLNFQPRFARNQVVAYFHTGGTTAAPKLAQHTQGNQVHAAWGASLMYAMNEDDVIINGFPLYHVAGAFVYGLSSLMSGATIVLPTLLGMRDQEFVQNYWKVTQRHQVTLLAGVPTVISALLEIPLGRCNISTVRCMLTGGSPLPTELAKQFEQRFNVPVRNILGMTECAGVISIIPFYAERVPGSCGLRLPFTKIKVVRFENDQPKFDQECKIGDTGMVMIRGPNVSPGYTDKARDLGTFTEDGWLISGDLGFVSELGELHLSGRAKDVIIRSSHNIDPVLIENALLKHSSVQTAAAVGAPDEYAGELPVAFVCLKAGHSVTEQELIDFVTPLIAEPPAVPKSITICDCMPLTPIGKIFKPSLRAKAIEKVIGDRVDKSFNDISKPSFRVKEQGSKFQIEFEVKEEGLAREQIDTFMVRFAIDYKIISKSQKSL
jgi:fatty-acyl-CoA synthase